MNYNQQLILVPGQVYLHADLNEYLVVTKTTRGEVSYRGNGFNGHAESFSFLERFAPVDPADLTEAEYAELQDFVPTTKLSIGFIAED